MDPLDSNPTPSISPSPQSEIRNTLGRPGKNHQPQEIVHESEPISISQKTQEIHQYTEALKDLPDVRQEQITRIQTALNNGTYQVSSKDLIDKLIQDISNPKP